MVEAEAGRRGWRDQSVAERPRRQPGCWQAVEADCVQHPPESGTAVAMYLVMAFAGLVEGRHADKVAVLPSGRWLGSSSATIPL